jgi:hypothetical protein
MSPQEFKQQWDVGGEPTVPVDGTKLSSLGLTLASIDFLISAGLPDSAAPFLSFADTGAKSTYYCVPLTKLYTFLSSEYDRFVSIGFDGAGNPLVIDTDENDCITWLDHEDDFAASYVNSSLGSLAVYLLAYRDFVQALIASKGDEAFLNGDFTDDEVEALRTKLKEQDGRALEEGTFWNMELQTLLANREHR